MDGWMEMEDRQHHGHGFPPYLSIDVLAGNRSKALWRENQTLTDGHKESAKRLQLQLQLQPPTQIMLTMTTSARQAY